MTRLPLAGDLGFTVEQTDEIDVRPCAHGPVLVRGATSVRDADGEDHPVTRPVVAVCACGKSQRGPWCDGTHKVIPRGR